MIYYNLATPFMKKHIQTIYILQESHLSSANSYIFSQVQSNNFAMIVYGIYISFVQGVLYPPFIESDASLSRCENLLPHLHHLLPLLRGEPLRLVQVDLGLVEPGADVSQVLVKDFHFILVTLLSYNRK